MTRRPRGLQCTERSEDSGEERDRHVASDDLEVATIEGEDIAAVPLRTRDHGSVRESQGKIPESNHELQ